MIIYKINKLSDAIKYHQQITECNEDKIIIDFLNASFIRNNYLAILGLAIELQKENGKEVEIIPPSKNKIKKSMEKIKFLANFLDDGIVNDDRNTVIKYSNIRKEDDEYYKFCEHFISQFNSTVNNLSSELSDKIIKKVLELCSNVFRHSASKLGLFCSGQFYPAKDKFYFTIVDGGETIKNNVNKYLEELTENNKKFLTFFTFLTLKRYNQLNGMEAIKWALIDNNSTTGSGGFGLSLLKELIIKSKGELEIISNDGHYKIDNGEEYDSILPNVFNGTVISIGFSTNKNMYYYLKKVSNEN